MFLYHVQAKLGSTLEDDDKGIIRRCHQNRDYGTQNWNQPRPNWLQSSHSVRTKNQNTKSKKFRPVKSRAKNWPFSIDFGNKNDDYEIFVIIVMIINGVSSNNPLETSRQGACTLTQELCRLTRQIVLINAYQHNLDINNFTKLLYNVVSFAVLTLQPP